MTRIAIIGAGFTGLCLAHLLQACSTDLEITVFEKGRGPGGRMSTRRIDAWHFDHGAQFFTARHPAFKRFLVPYIDAGIIEPWQPKLVDLAPNAPPYRRGWFEPHYVAVPAMNSLAQSLAAGTTVVLQHEVKRLQRQGKEWLLQFADGQVSEPFDWVISTLPASMASALLPAEFTGIQALRRVLYSPSTSLMMGFDEDLQLPWDAAKVHDSRVTWLVRGASRPGHLGPDTLLIQSTAVWARDTADINIRDASAELEGALRALPGFEDLPVAPCRYLHRWRFAALERRADAPAYLDAGLRLAACGEWGLEGNVESCYLSALALYAQMDVLGSRLRTSPQQMALESSLRADGLALSGQPLKTGDQSSS